MAYDHTVDHPLIDAYLASIEPSLRARRDGEDAIDELRDHLLAAVERNEESGLSHTAAQEKAIAAMGAPAVVADAYHRNGRGQPAVPTSFTKLGGTAAYSALVGMAITVAAWPIADRIEHRDGWESGSQFWYTIGSIGVLWATASLLVVTIATVRRHGGLGVAGIAAITLGALGATMSIIAWALAVWATLLAASWIVLTLAVRRAAVAPTRAMAAIAVGFAGLPILNVVSDEAAQAGWSGDSWAQIAGPVFGAACVAAIAVGCVAIGRWLTSEDPIDIGTQPLAA